MKKRIEQAVNDNIRLKSQLLNEEGIKFISQVSEVIISQINNGGKVLLCGNGGSAADAQHFAAEFVGRFMKDRKPLPAVALTTDSSILTAVGNDYNFESVFLRQIRALCTSNDVVIGISTSGNSGNVVEAFKCARSIGAKIVALLGNTGGKCIQYADYNYVVDSCESARIQEVHLLLEHLICEFVEKAYIDAD